MNDYESYLVLVSPSVGVSKVVGIGITIKSAGDGTELRSQFDKIQILLTEKYGKPKDSFDLVDVGSVLTEPQYFMLGLLQKERTLESFWELPDGTMIQLAANAQTRVGASPFL